MFIPRSFFGVLSARPAAALRLRTQGAHRFGKIEGVSHLGGTQNAPSEFIFNYLILFMFFDDDEGRRVKRNADKAVRCEAVWTG